jgi:glutaminase
MGTCGMYDYAGQWLYEVGMPAKSGVAGGIAAVLPGQIGIGVFSPRLDKHGNSVRGIRVCSELSRDWDLHLFNRAGVGSSMIRHRLSAAQFGSSRVRAARERIAIGKHGGSIVRYQLQGNLVFATAELVIRELTSVPENVESIILDFHYVHSINETACRLFHDLLLQFDRAGRNIMFCDISGTPHLRRVMKAKLGNRFDEIFRVFEDGDTALQWCEDHMLERVLPQLPEMSIGADNYELLNGFSPDELLVLRKFFERREWRAGETICTAGDNARDIYLLARGRVSVHFPLENGRSKRLAVFTAGMTFGEMAVLDRAPHSANIIADTQTACDLISMGKLVAIGVTYPKIKIRLLENLALGLSSKLRKAHQEASLLV